MKLVALKFTANKLNNHAKLQMSDPKARLLLFQKYLSAIHFTSLTCNHICEMGYVYCEDQLSVLNDV